MNKRKLNLESSIAVLNLNGAIAYAGLFLIKCRDTKENVGKATRDVKAGKILLSASCLWSVGFVTYV